MQIKCRDVRVMGATQYHPTVRRCFAKGHRMTEPNTQVKHIKMRKGHWLNYMFGNESEN